MMDRLELEKILYSEIPITRAMGISVQDITDNSIRLEAPLDKNINHKSTAFGGSLYSLCVLTGWCLLYTRLKAVPVHAHIVIQESQIRYLLPVSADMESICCSDDESPFERAMHLFMKKGKARFELKTTISQADEVAVVFQGKYVVHR